jgi:hypothetical protein
VESSEEKNDYLNHGVLTTSRYYTFNGDIQDCP